MAIENRDTRKKGSVPSVDFYGDSSTWPTSELVHSEELVERSALHGWRIRPHRHNDTVQLFLVLEGDGRARLDSVWQSISAPCLVVVPERAVHEFEWSKSSNGYVLSIRTTVIKALAQRISRLDLGFSEVAVIDILPARESLQALFAAVHRETQERSDLMDAALESLIAVLAIWLTRNAALRSGPTQHRGRAGQYFDRFVKLVDRHHKSHWSVAAYANAIGITPSHLNSVCHMSSGTSTLQMIHARLILAAQRELAYTERNIAGVADNLGFIDPSYFTRFFKRETGMTPSEYRRRSGTVEGEST